MQHTKKPQKETIVCASMPQNRKHVVMVDTTGKKGYASLPTTHSKEREKGRGTDLAGEVEVVVEASAPAAAAVVGQCRHFICDEPAKARENRV